MCNMHMYIYSTQLLCQVFFYQDLLPQTLTVKRTTGEGRGSFFILSTTSSRSRIFGYLFATLYVWWSARIFNCTACNCKVTQWDLPPYHLIVGSYNLSFCLFYLAIRFKAFVTAISQKKLLFLYHPCISSGPTNRVDVMFPISQWIQ